MGAGGSVEVGVLAPDFELKDQHGQLVRLSDFRGHTNMVVMFYPFAFSQVCTSELNDLRDDLTTFENKTTATLAISVDSMYALRTFADAEGYTFPLLADFWPHGAVAAAYGVFNDQIGAATRGTFIIDTEGVVRWKVVNPLPEARSRGEYAKVLSGL
jgi:mycoredoxin-dependent peroxiredoxin